MFKALADKITRMRSALGGPLAKQMARALQLALL
jgi:hypothetical protein